MFGILADLQVVFNLFTSKLKLLFADPTHVIGLYPHLLPTKLKSSLMYPEDISRLEGVDYEKGLIALIEYLNDVSIQDIVLVNVLNN